MALFDFLVIAVFVWGIVKIISRWLRTKDGIAQRRMQELEQRLHVLETQRIQDLHKRISVLEEIFVTEDVALQRKLRHALGVDALATPPQAASVRPPEHP
jgi:hypothetical protein